MLLTEKLVTDKSEPENDLFCHTLRGSDHRFYLFIFTGEHESHFKKASHRTTLTTSKANTQISFLWRSFMGKKRKPKVRAIPRLSPSALPLLQPHVLPSASAFPGKYWETTDLMQKSAGSDIAQLAQTRPWHYYSMALYCSSRAARSRRHSQPWPPLCLAILCSAEKPPGCNSGMWRRHSPPKFGVSMSSDEWQPKTNQLFTWRPEDSLHDRRPCYKK